MKTYELTNNELDFVNRFMLNNGCCATTWQQLEADNYSWQSMRDLKALFTEYNTQQIGGYLSSLIDKDVIGQDDEDQKLFYLQCRYVTHRANQEPNEEPTEHDGFDMTVPADREEEEEIYALTKEELAFANQMQPELEEEEEFVDTVRLSMVIASHLNDAAMEISTGDLITAQKRLRFVKMLNFTYRDQPTSQVFLTTDQLDQMFEEAQK